jgi:hypothetical protein
MFTWTTVKYFEETPIQFVKLTKTIWKMFLDIDECFSYINNCRHKNSYCTNTYESFLCTCAMDILEMDCLPRSIEVLVFGK